MLRLPPLEATTTALVIVDVQERLMPAMFAPHARRLLAAVDILVDAAHRLGMPIFATEQYPRGLGPTVEPLRTQLAGLDPAPVKVDKLLFTAFADAAITEPLLRAGAFKAVIVVGVEAHVCVYQTVRDLVAAGLPAYVPFDAVASREPACRDAALALLTRAGAAVTTTETVVFDLLKSSASPHFKPLSAKIKELPTLL